MRKPLSRKRMKRIHLRQWRARKLWWRVLDEFFTPMYGTLVIPKQ